MLKDCELLENDICSQEYAIAKKHHLLGRVVHLPNCSTLPKTNCFELGIEKPEVNEGRIKKKLIHYYILIEPNGILIFRRAVLLESRRFVSGHKVIVSKFIMRTMEPTVFNKNVRS